MKIRGVQLTGTIYRNGGVPLYDEGPDDGLKRPRSRVSGRFDRSNQWSPEHDRILDAPPRSATQHERWSEHVVLARQTHGSYVLVSFRHRYAGKGRMVEAKCTAGHCDSKVSWFDPGEWFRSPERMQCNRCTTATARITNAAARLAKAGPTRGLYALVEVVHDKERIRIKARCTGSACLASRIRIFDINEWVSEDPGDQCCNKCAKRVRGQSAGEAGLAVIQKWNKERRGIEPKSEVA